MSSFFLFGNYSTLQFQTLVTCGILKLIWAIFGQYSHISAHSDKPGNFYKYVRRFRLAISKENHKKHHMSPHEDNFCITSGLSEPLVQWCYFNLGYHMRNILFLATTLDILFIGLFLGYICA